MLKMVLCNLISNAIKFTKTVGKIKSKLALKFEYLQITVAENDVDLNVEICKDIFGEFKISFGISNYKGFGRGLFLFNNQLRNLGS
jgi:K+-sensing histidine kinase KdpD